MKIVREEWEPCQYYYADMARTTLPDTRLALPLRRYWWNLKRYVWYISILGLGGFASRIFPSTKLGKLVSKRGKKSARKKLKPRSVDESDEVLNLQPGDWAEVRSVKEIFTTLDAQGKLKGLRFTPEMVKFCGKRFKVYRRLEKIILEATGELRKIRTPTVLLEGVFCDGEAHGGCDRSCFCFWREAWLKGVSPTASTE
jgi:hypothetical protein